LIIWELMRKTSKKIKQRSVLKPSDGRQLGKTYSIQAGSRWTNRDTRGRKLTARQKVEAKNKSKRRSFQTSRRKDKKAH